MPCSRSPGGVPGPHPRGKLRGSGRGVYRPTPWGACLPRGVPAPGGWRPPVMATAAGGTHPTGMHSCLL